MGNLGYIIILLLEPSNFNIAITLLGYLDHRVNAMDHMQKNNSK